MAGPAGTSIFLSSITWAAGLSASRVGAMQWAARCLNGPHKYELAAAVGCMHIYMEALMLNTSFCKPQTWLQWISIRSNACMQPDR